MYHIFISHAWEHNDDYYTVERWIKESGISYKNYSVPQHDPLKIKTEYGLKKALTEQIKHANIVIIIAGMYAHGTYSKWIDYEIDEAVSMGKYIIGIYPHGQERIPEKITRAAHQLVRWNSSSLISAIQKA